MNNISEQLRTTAEIEDMAGRPFTGNQLREAIAEIERLQADKTELTKYLDRMIDLAAKEVRRANEARSEIACLQELVEILTTAQIVRAVEKKP